MEWESPGLVPLGGSVKRKGRGNGILCTYGSAASADCKTGPSPGQGCANGGTATDPYFCSEGGGLTPP